MSEPNSKSQLFKSKYKFIDFKKRVANETTEPSDLVHTELETNGEIKEFYNELISIEQDNESEIIEVKSENDKSQPALKSHVSQTKIDKKIPTEKEFLAAAQSGNQELIKEFLEFHGSLMLNTKDQFGWNALMISIAAENNEIVNYFFDKQSQNQFFNEFITTKDHAGNDPESIAIRANNLTALRIIQDFKSDSREPELVILDSSDEESSNLESFCETCQIEYTGVDHLNSISHQMSLNEQGPSKEISYNYHLRSNNKGYQLLCKTGWENRKGLGKSEQGHVFPVKTKQKLDRKGIGVEAEAGEPKYTFNKKLCLEKAAGPSQIRIESQIKHVKYLEKKRKREKALEKRMRTEFNS